MDGSIEIGTSNERVGCDAWYNKEIKSTGSGELGCSCQMRKKRES